MNNEEKILGILERIDQRLVSVESGMSEMKSDISGLKTDMSEVKQRVRSIEVTQETTVATRLQLLAEGQTTIQNQIRSLSVIDQLQDDVSTLKNAVRYLSERIEHMEQAALEKTAM